MSYYMVVNAVSRVKKKSLGVIINEGDRIKIALNPSGHGALVRNKLIRFGPDDYDLFIPEEEYDKLLKD